LSRPKVHVLFEHGYDHQPFGSAYIRLLRPLFYPKVQEYLEVSAGIHFENRETDAVIIDRLWKPESTRSDVEALVEAIRKHGSKIIYALDDYFLEMDDGNCDYRLSEEQVWIVKFLLHEVDGIFVPTTALRDRLCPFNPSIAVIPHALDENLIKVPLARDRSTSPRQGYREDDYTGSRHGDRNDESKAIKIGYMGTFTHDDDLRMVLPALRTIGREYKGMITFEFLGVFNDRNLNGEALGIPARMIRPSAKQSIYPSFMRWFTSRFEWQIALSPLRKTPFNECKSDIKFLDYCALGAVGIYSDIQAYRNSVKHKQTGWLASDDDGSWIEGMKELIENEELRFQIARESSTYLFSNRILAHRYMQWVDAILNVLH
jgi:processive 1,2-diacylglycerol beta-glucosyltransferase